MCGEIKKRFLLLYGTQQGQSKAISEEIGQQAEHHGFTADIYSLKDFKKFNLETERDPVVIVISTTGTGDPPDAAIRFLKEIQNKEHPVDYFANLKYAVLALGDSEYTYFCNGGKIIDWRLQELGAKHFYETGYADDCVGLELVVDPWIEGLWTALHSEFIPRTEKKNTDHMKNMSTEKPATDEVPENLELRIQAINLEHSVLPKYSLAENTGSESNRVIKPSLLHSGSLLSQSNLNVPVLPSPYLDVCVLESEGQSTDLSLLYPEEKIFNISIIQAKELTSADAVKTVLMLELDISNTSAEFQPGDSFSIICPNPHEEVEMLLEKLTLAEKRDCQVHLGVKLGTKKKGASVPGYIPEGCSLQFIFTWCLEIRAVPKKAMIRALVEHTSNAAEKRRLQELCSKQGGSDYNHFIRDNSISILDLLNVFPSCSPPLNLLIEHLPKLQARPYSAASSPLYHPGKVHIVFTVVELPTCPDRPAPRKGVCTGWLAELVSHMYDTAELKKDFPPKISIFARPSTSFHLPRDPSVPILMVGPGTGIAPFIGFLQHREKLKEQNKERIFGDTWLFFGCRSHENEYLFRQELRHFTDSGVLTHLKVCFSRDPPINAGVVSPKYVQDFLKICSSDIAKVLTKENGSIYVCGDAKNMAKDVNDALANILCMELNMDKLEAINTLAVLRDQKCYLQDVWS
ncbi:hypothetical protein XENTR_v10016503 [Xenopus tropicalis]|uniref:Methionine synthase reductase n=1 Tax=Xenopus tropicalis TaxID=8364 RepID=A0A8J0T1R8_XENTR|nr:methionine synthase reductase isoform X2 [Xenopus tropicalis]KAE8597538.1 hypothetical protein XENTR_v10016503 [Xenopus tropicalis]|eukprot:XP_017950416.1 PREDICTED: methionine synthase reductase [Xenopus tropicalis]